MSRFVQLLAVFAAFLSCNSAEIPSYLTTCSRSDPNFQKCCLESGRRAIPQLAKGDKRLKLRVLEPLAIPEIRIDTSGNLKLTLTDVILYGLGNMQLRKMNFDLEKQTISLDMHNDNIQVIGDYTIDGRILILPITGNGKINVTMVNGAIGYSFQYDIIQKNGVEYIKALEPDVTLVSERTYYKLDNLFNGDKRLGEEMNKFLNENHKEMSKELNPSITETISAIATEIVENVLNVIPYHELVRP
ncbi:PREDICTED: protein takeout-like [Nicrophorus vespilloides]|uniref:Protein takeout-like n=1 Tax=Nicrophorus vespilloides TaxID=110193 RepID=A0ABM1MHB4_NICVS|nr:PREDICTED: protein takeout-like [Nicrophorus vespilloides]